MPGFQKALVTKKTGILTDLCVLTAVQFFKVSDPLSGSEGVSPFKLVIREEFSEAVVPSYQKKQWKEAFLPPQGHYFLDYPFILCWVYIKSTGQAYPECSVH